MVQTGGEEQHKRSVGEEYFKGQRACVKYFNWFGKTLIKFESCCLERGLWEAQVLHSLHTSPSLLPRNVCFLSCLLTQQWDNHEHNSTSFPRLSGVLHGHLK